MKVDNTICAVVVGTPGDWQLALNAHTGRDAHAAATIKDHGPELQMWKKKKKPEHRYCIWKVKTFSGKQLNFLLIQAA